ncbi:activator of Hsp90 ATPase, amine-terminal protein [Gregarina niphandrodes]|uniref:Activator of Hsp90 ATPase, amine-terminal protein n=1 Tax=Gregarina niphandrodes TaxID=110365 RepID=A0A023BBJ1_GRENI|nr:activator of Hsp90 ATPase, amine-terminal protein [Gregarina niphandrodes]EZG79459.1 activator of Hsp90 ATPase, amine-terminal protein [Gregarina niphandrodes]|eukprot:XP_011134436.1 activator of Hsp90 ATPase, amine-terminal protein [Gregarina niphandrodes]
MAGSEDSFVEDSTKIEHAGVYKQQGNDELKAGKYVEAIARYEEGLKALDGCVDKHSAAFNECQDSLNGNLCLAAMKNGQWYVGIHSANKVLTNSVRNPALHQKVRYRRGVCHLGVGNFDEAETDLNQVVQADATNTEAKRRLQECKEERAKAAKLEKQRFGGKLFGGKDNLYADREAERLAKEKKERDDYAQDILSKDITFEQWRERRRQEAKKDQEATASSEGSPNKGKESPAKTKESPNKSKESPTKKAAAPPKSQSAKVADELVLDEEDLKIIEETKKRGYCYFRKQLTEEERKLKDTVHVPQKMVEEQQPSPSKKGVSDWNASGATYEEKDTTKWCISMLTNQLENSNCTASGLAIENINAKDMAGDAQIMVVRGRVRHFFDFNLKLEFDMLDGEKTIGHAVWTIDSMSSENLDGFLNFKQLKWQTTPPLQYVDRLPTMLNHFKDTLRAGVDTFCKLYDEKH